MKLRLASILFALTPAPLFAASEDLLPEVQALLDMTLDGAQGQEDTLHRICVIAHGGVQPLIDALALEREHGAGARAHTAAHLEAHFLWRRGDLESARERYAKLAEDPLDFAARTAQAKLLDAQGKTTEALEAYAGLLPSLEGDEQSFLRLRMALMSMQSGAGEDKDALAVYAGADGSPTDLRNRAAVVLALLERPADALGLFEVEGEGTQAFKGEVRVAEWAVRADDAPMAQAAAWRAARAATLGRDRRYALTVLVEAHRMDDSLGTLIERFATTPDLTTDEREVWIGLLRETERYDEAIELFRSAQGSDETFTVDMRRELLEMYREAGQEGRMVEAYLELINAEPARIAWREGLARYHLERGDRDAAVQVWQSYIDLERDLIFGAEALRGLGLDQESIICAEACIERDVSRFPALLFLFALHRDRGDLPQAEATLRRIDEFAAPENPVRMDLSEAWEQLGGLEEAVRVLEGVVAARGEEETGEDLAMRLAWLYSEIGEEEQAMAAWHTLWLRVKSIPRRRYVEDRMMTVAARLGTLADIAVDLEQKLIAGTATENDSGLLVRLYTKVGDAVSAGEVIDEFLKASGGNEIDALQEKARVYLTCTDFYNYEKTVWRLIDIDPEGEDEYLRQLAMSQLERGRPDQAREVLEQLKSLSTDTDAAEFEAGVLSLAGMRAEAISAYQVGLAAHPERIDSYLLMSGLMKTLGQTDRAVGMFQYLAENAERDDLFTIAIDGLLNMLVDAPPRPDMVEWARRITLERLARRHDKMYLYQLLSDLSEEAQDREGMMRALENSLATSGSRRTSVLRELMDIAKGQGDSFMGRGWSGDTDKHLAYGRRLIGVGEAVPPGVYLDLGEAFLEADDAASAAKTFSLARDLPDEQVFRRQTAGLFEKAGYVADALETFEAVLVTQPTDVSLLVKVGELHEMLGKDNLASKLYLQAIDLLMKRRPLSTEKVEEEVKGRMAWWAARNVDDYDQYYQRVLGGVLASITPARAEGLIASQREALARDLEAVNALRGANPEAAKELAQYPRLVRRAQHLRRLAVAFGFGAAADELDRKLLAEFDGDEGLLEELVRERLRWGLVASARALIGASGRDAEATAPMLALVGEGAESELTRPVPLAEAVRRVLPLLIEGHEEEARTLLARAAFGSAEQEDVSDVTALFSAARYLDDPGLALRIGREWVRLQVKYGQGSYEVEPVLETVGGALDLDGRKALYQFFVSTILDDPEKSGQYVTLLPKLQSEFEEPLLDEEQVLEMLDGYGERGAWGLAPVLVLLPPAERAGMLRSIWPKVEKTRRTMFLLQLVGDFDEELGAELAAFITESFPETLNEADDFFKYYVRQLLDSEHNAEVALTLAKHLESKLGEDAQLLALRALKLEELGREEAGAVAASALIKIAQMDSDDYEARNAQRKLREVFLPDELERFVAALDAHIAEHEDSVQLELLRIDLYAESDDEAGEVAALAAALVAFPDEVEVVTRQRTTYQRQGRTLDALRVTERLIELEQDDEKRKRLRQDLVRRWKSLGHYEEALAAFQALESDGGADATVDGPFAGLPPGAMIVINGAVQVVGAAGPKGPAKTIDAVKKSIEDGAPEEARATLRRLWRQFPAGEETTRRFFGFGYSPMANLRWPRDETDQTPEEEADARRRRRGGLDAYDEVEPPAREPLPNAYEVLAEHDFAVAEMQRFLRTQEPAQLDRLQPLYEGLFAARTRTQGADAALEELLAEVRAGSADKIDYVLLLAALDAAPERATAEVQGVLRDLLRTLNPKDAAQIRRLARVQARAGARGEALRLYRWCATRVNAGTTYFYMNEEDGSSSVSAQELVKDAKEVLEGDERVALIAAVLDFARPSDVPWQRESFEVLSIETWEDLLGPAEALTRARALCEASCDLSTGLRRRVALRAATLFANAGELDLARRALEVGLCKLDPAAVKQPTETWYRVYPENFGYLGHADLRRMFPPNGGELADPAGWYRVVAESLGTWLAEERVQESAAIQALALAATRLAEVGEEERAAGLVEELAVHDLSSPNLYLWIADAARRVGIGSVGDDLERRLLDEGRLSVDRIHEVVNRTLASEGPTAALELGTAAANYTRKPALIEALVTAAEMAGNVPLADDWRARGRSAADAEAQLERLEEEAKENG